MINNKVCVDRSYYIYDMKVNLLFYFNFFFKDHVYDNFTYACNQKLIKNYSLRRQDAPQKAKLLK